jgi:hypothetical protein
MTEVIRPALTVDTGEVRELVDRLNATCARARQLQHRLDDLGPDVTGLELLSAALREHARQWGWTIELIEDRIRDVAYRLEAAADTYEQLEGCVQQSLSGDSTSRER